jgi:hypothetical protein
MEDHLTAQGGRMIRYDSFPPEHWQHKANDNTAECQARYQDYLRTDRWMLLKHNRSRMDKNTCVLCGKDAEVAHHRRYPEVLGTETEDDLVSLCGQCHDNYHLPPSVTTLRDQILAAANDNGADCPVCMRNVKFRKYTFNSAMASCVTACYAVSLLPEVVAAGGWFHLATEFERKRELEFVRRGRQHARVCLWGLIEKKEDAGGFYRMTELGEAFVENRASILEWVVIYMAKALAWSEDRIFITDVRRKGFDINEIRKACGLTKFEIMNAIPKKAMPKKACA